MFGYCHLVVRTRGVEVETRVAGHLMDPLRSTKNRKQHLFLHPSPQAIDVCLLEGSSSLSPHDGGFRRTQGIT